MALITVSGYPSSGKTRRAEALKAYLDQRLKDPFYKGPNLKTVLISDHLLNIDRTVYNDGRQEKPARAALFTSMQRQMDKDVILIVDALNYIKGFRYQMYCAAREQRLRVCTLYVVATPELCRQWNDSRNLEHRYNPETLENLIMRYEEPSSMVRWDSPLFTVTWSEDNVLGDQIWAAVTEGVVKPPNAGTSVVAKAPVDALHTLEQTTTDMVSAILSQQAATQGIGGPTILPLSATLKPQLTLPTRNVTLAELQRLKRQFVTVHKKAITLGTTEKGSVDWSAGGVANKFVTYLEENLRQ